MIPWTERTIWNLATTDLNVQVVLGWYLSRLYAKDFLWRLRISNDSSLPDGEFRLRG